MSEMRATQFEISGHRDFGRNHWQIKDRLNRTNIRHGVSQQPHNYSILRSYRSSLRSFPITVKFPSEPRDIETTVLRVHNSEHSTQLRSNSHYIHKLFYNPTSPRRGSKISSTILNQDFITRRPNLLP